MKQQGHNRFYTPNVHDINTNSVHTYGNPAGVPQPNQGTLAGHNLQPMPQMAATQQIQQQAVQQPQMGHPSRAFVAQHSGRQPRHPQTGMMQQRPSNPVMAHNAAVNQQTGAMIHGYYNPQQFMITPSMMNIQRHQYQQPPYQLVYYPPNGPYMMTAPQYSTAAINQQQAQPVRTTAQINIPPQNTNQYVQMSQPTPPFIASTENQAQSTEPAPAFQPPPVTRPPVAKRERHAAIIQDPNSGRILSEQELQSKSPVQPEKMDIPAEASNQTTVQQSSDAALEFRDKVASVALGTQGKETTENHSAEPVVDADAVNEIDEEKLTKIETETQATVSDDTSNCAAAEPTPVTSEMSAEQHTSAESKELIVPNEEANEVSTTNVDTKTPETKEPEIETVSDDSHVVVAEADSSTSIPVDSEVKPEIEDIPPVVEPQQTGTETDSPPESVPTEVLQVKPEMVDAGAQTEKEELCDTKTKSGKLEYRSDFLKSLQSAPESMKKPVTLPKLDIIHDIPVSQREPNERYSRHSNAGIGQTADMFLPHFIHNPSSRNNQSQRSSSQRQIHSRPSQQDRTVRKIISPSLTQDVKLHTVDNAWKPAAKGAETTDEEAKTSELLKAFRGILNKLTPQKYQKLLEEVKKLTIDSEVRLQGILELIFDKAVDEPAFCLQYANLCKHLAASLKEAVGSDENGIGKKFTPLLLTRCQKEFESKMYEGIDVEGKQAIIDETTDEEKRKLLRAELDEEKRKARKRSLGNIKLIGELYLLGMLKANIMMSCVERLLRDNEEESLECLCTLLRTIGSKLECDVKEFEIKKGLKKDSVLSPYINALIEYVNEKRTSARVRFMIQDVLDMRMNNWKARKIQDENKPKTIDEIHSEAQEEEKKKMAELQHHTQHKRQESMKKSGDWKNKNSKDVNMMLKNLKNTSADSNMQFGPGNFGGLWSQGARGGSQQKQDSQMGSNRMDDRKMSRPVIQQRDSSKGQSRNASSHHSDVGRKGDSGFGSQEGDAWVRKPAARPGPPPFGSDVICRTRDRDSRNSSMEKGSAPSSRGSSMRRESQKPHVELKQEEVETRSMTLIKEYLSNNDPKETIVEDLQSFCSDENYRHFVVTAVNHALDISSHQHQLSVGELFLHIFNKKLYSRDRLYEGLNGILEFADDMVVDVPKFFDYMGNILSPFFVNLDDNLRKSFFATGLKCTGGSASKLMCHVLKSACQSSSPAKVGSLWRSGDLNWTEFLSSNENVDDFVEKNSLQFTISEVDGSSECETLNDCANRERFFGNVTRIVLNSASTSNNDELIELIEKSFNSNEEKTDPNFVSALVKAVVQGCVNSAKVNGDTSYTVDSKRLESKCAVLAKYCDNDEEREAKCLYALQQLAEELEHPSKLLNTIFATLHDQNVISSEAFLQWESTNTTSQGKAVAALSVRQFLTWLKEGEESDN